MGLREGRILLTFDKDFGELAWRAGLPASSGIILFRLPMPAAADVGVNLAARIGCVRFRHNKPYASAVIPQNATGGTNYETKPVQIRIESIAEKHRSQSRQPL